MDKIALSRLTQILWMDADDKYFMLSNKNYSSKALDNKYSMMAHAPSAPANNNGLQKTGKHLLAEQFADNRNVMLYDVQPTDLHDLTFAAPSMQMIKSSIFIDAGARIVTMSPVDQMSMAAKAKTQAQNTVFDTSMAETKDEPVVETTVPEIVFDGTVVPFKRKTLSIAS